MICFAANRSMLTFLGAICRGFMEINKFINDLVKSMPGAIKYFYLRILLYVKDSLKFKNSRFMNQHSNKGLSCLSFVFMASDSWR